VEHPVTEMITDLDLVEWQLRVAAGEPLPFAQDGVRFSGHAVEARVYAEDPARGFLPTGGRVLALREPSGTGVRVDSALSPGLVVGSDYDPMLAKIAAWGPDRASALRRLEAALAETVVLGVTTNVAFLRALLAHPDVASGDLDTGLVERELAALLPSVAAAPGRAEALAVAALILHRALFPGAGPDPWDVPDGWRLGGAAWTRFRLADAAGAAEVRVRAPAVPEPGVVTAEVAVDEGEAVPARLSWDGQDPATLLAELGTVTRRYTVARGGDGGDGGDTVWLAGEDGAWRFDLRHPGEPGERGAGHPADGVVRSPMPGTVLVVKAAPGERVAAGQPLVIVEAMKMEHAVAAPVDGVVAELPVRAGQPVEMDALLAVVRPVDEPVEEAGR
jgi:acetyl-CoA/propionyl-CoA carboxylase biotin carboxyl carrier protein